MGFKEFVGLGNGDHRPQLRAVPDPDTTDTALIQVETAGDQPSEDQPNTDLEPKVFDGEVIEDQPTAEADHPSSEGPADDEDQAGTPVPVDPPARRERVDLIARARGDETRSPVLAPWLKDRAELRDVTRWLAGFVGHTAAYHLVRVPLYVAKLTGRSPRGVYRTLRAIAGWVLDAEGAPLRREAVDRKDADEYMALDGLRRDRLKWRFLLVLPLLLAAAGLVAASVGALAVAVLAAVSVVVFGVIGSPADKPLIGRSVVTQKAPRLTSDLVVRALAALGIAQINAAVGPKGTGITFPAPIVRDGPGWRATVDLPYGVTVDDIMDRRDKLASGLRRPLGCVWPESVEDEHAGRLVLWVGDQDMAKAKPTPFPLARSGRTDLFEPVPFGTDQRGRPVNVQVMFANVLIGAMPRYGKTFALRVLLLAAALDPHAQLRLFEFKGTGDFAPLEPVAHHYGTGADDETKAACMDSLRDLYRELNVRAKTIRNLPRDICPESKVTPELAARRSLGLHTIVCGLDEVQELFTDPTHGKEAAELTTAIIKRGPALGIILILATQRPDKDSLPTGVSANVGIRFCLRVMGQVENDMVLGTSMYKKGVRATSFTGKDRGIGFLVGATDDPKVTRSYYVDGLDADRIIARARALRATAGTLTGHAIGELTTPDGAPLASLLDDLAAVIPAAEDKVWSETICARLADLRPDTYDGWKPAQLAAAVKPYGITTRQVWLTDDTGAGRNRYGLHRADVLDALNQRKRRTDGDDEGGPSDI
ncbi:MAG: cell division protein FtsK [Streptosporangiales bacterium]|nr:cell division protein FtsK [Streptosporangiales bacterium]